MILWCKNRRKPVFMGSLLYAIQIYNIFRRKANRPFRVLTFRRRQGLGCDGGGRAVWRRWACGVTTGPWVRRRWACGAFMPCRGESSAGMMMHGMARCRLGLPCALCLPRPVKLSAARGASEIGWGGRFSPEKRVVAPREVLIVTK